MIKPADSDAPKLTSVSKEDPKPGRWILPIVITALIGFTYVFVNALPAADVTPPATAARHATTTTTTTIPQTTTSTTLPIEVRAFLQELDRFENMTSDLQSELEDVNTKWENRDILFSAADTGFSEVREDAQDLANQIAAASVPDPFTTAWPDTVAASKDLVAQLQTVIDGLRAPDDGTLRRAAVDSYSATSAAFTKQLDVVRGLTP